MPGGVAGLFIRDGDQTIIVWAEDLSRDELEVAKTLLAGQMSGAAAVIISRQDVARAVAA